LGVLGAGAVLVTLNTRFKGGEAAYILRASGAKTLLTVDGFLGLDYPGMLAGEDNGSLERVVVLRREPGAGRRDQATTARGGRPRLIWAIFLAGAQQVSAVAAAARSSAIAPEEPSRT